MSVEPNSVTTIQIGPMHADDWLAVREIYAAGIAGGNATFETEPPTWEQWDSAHLDVCRLVARTGTGIVGWAALQPVSSRPAYAGVAEASLYVGAHAQGRGIGRALVTLLIEATEREGIWTIQTGVFPENESSLALCRKAGFRVVGVRERIGRLNGVWRDVLMLERRSAVTGC